LSDPTKLLSLPNVGASVSTISATMDTDTSVSRYIPTANGSPMPNPKPTLRTMTASGPIAARIMM